MSRAGFFTLGVEPDAYTLPHPRLGLPVILLIRRVLCRAFELLREQEFNLAAAREDEVTTALRSVIANDLYKTGSVRGFNHHNYESVVRQAQFANYNGTHHSQAPDLCFKLRYGDFRTRMTAPEHDALFVECKPVDSSHYAGSNYCDDGLNRFVEGQYAWAMQEGMMLAYARDGRTIPGHLIPAMSEPNRMMALATVQLPQPCAAPNASSGYQAESIHISKHRRDFEWLDGKGPATDITIYHLWHDCS